jgi:hypothetical protein
MDSASFLASVLWLVWGMFEPSGVSGWILLCTMTILAVALLVRTRKELVPGSKVIALTLLTLFGVFLF